jgi:hypothetical protein
MLKIQKLYRKDYTGEDIVASNTLEGGSWKTVTEHVPNNVINNQISNRAVVFGNGLHRQNFNPGWVINRRSGLLAATTLQSYACNAFYRDYTPDFLVVTSRDIAKEIVRTPYINENIVYTRVDITLEFPKKFYLIPHDLYADAGTAAIYLACFDGHKRVYLVGFDGQDTVDFNYNIYAGTNGYGAANSEVDSAKWAKAQKAVFDTYTDVDFVHVSESGSQRLPVSWKYCPNLRQISHRDMVIEADL